MSFGVSVGDILAVVQFTWNVYKACKGAPSEFKEISREVSTLHTVFKGLQDEVEDKDSILNRAGKSKREELGVLVGHCRVVLQQLERLVTRYWSLGTNQKRTQDRIEFDTKEVQAIRGKLTFHTSAIQLFLHALATGWLGRIEKKTGRIEKKLEIIIGASTTSARTAAASGNKATRTPTIVTPNNETNRLGRNDSRKLRPPKSEARSSSPHRTEGSTHKDNKGSKTKDQSPRTMDRLSDPSKSKNSSSSPHRTDTSAQKDNKGSKAKGQSTRTVDLSNRPSESKTSSSSPQKTASSAPKDNKGSKAKEQSSMIRDPLTDPRPLPREAKIVERPLHLTLEELFTGTRKEVKIPLELFDKSGKQVISDEFVEFQIKPGLRTGFEFKREGVAEDDPQHIFILTEEPHSTFTRDKNNINSVVELEPEEAFTGWSRTVFTIDGKCVPLSGAGPTPPGYQVTIPGLGMPKSRSPEERGDFIVTIKVKFPSSLSKDGKKSMEQALRASASRSDI